MDRNIRMFSYLCNSNAFTELDGLARFREFRSFSPGGYTGKPPRLAAAAKPFPRQNHTTPYRHPV